MAGQEGRVRGKKCRRAVEGGERQREEKEAREPKGLTRGQYSKGGLGSEAVRLELRGPLRCYAMVPGG